MKKSSIFLCVGCLMLMIAIIFVWFALNHPEASFPFGRHMAYVIYIVYVVLDIVMFILWKKSKKRK